MDKPKRTATTIATAYAAVGTLWILISDSLVQTFLPANSEWAQLFKGLGFVAATTAALFFLLRRHERRTERLFAALSEREVRVSSLNGFLEAVIHNSRVWINALDNDGNITLWNRAAEETSGYRREEVVGNDRIWEWVYPDPEHRARVMEQVTELLREGEEMTDVDIPLIARNGSRHIIRWQARPLWGDDGQLGGAVAVGVDVTDRLRLEQELQHFASYDLLTGLLNRRALEERLGEEVERARRYRRPISVILVDLDAFKTLNDSRGHAAGDAALRRVGQLIRDNLREADFAARFGGDELVVVAPEATTEQGTELAERLRYMVAEDPGADPPLTLSLGVACLATDSGDDEGPEQLLLAADRALYRAKADGRNRVCTAAPRG